MQLLIFTKNIPENDNDMVDKTIELYKLSNNANIAKYCVSRFPLLKDGITKKFNEEFGIDLKEYFKEI